MSDWQYVQIRSWHVVRTPTRAFDTYVTLCGRRAVGESVEVLPFPAGKSCETCLRLAIKRADRPVQVAAEIGQSEDDGSTHEQDTP